MKARVVGICPNTENKSHGGPSHDAPRQSQQQVGGRGHAPGLAASACWSGVQQSGVIKFVRATREKRPSAKPSFLMRVMAQPILPGCGGSQCWARPTMSGSAVSPRLCVTRAMRESGVAWKPGAVTRRQTASEDTAPPPDDTMVAATACKTGLCQMGFAVVGRRLWAAPRCGSS